MNPIDPTQGVDSGVAKQTPWLAVTYGDAGRDWFIHGKDNAVVARVFDEQYGNTPMSAEDHARLIAAAPELFAVVRKVVDWNARYPASRIYSHDRILVIAKEMDEINALAIAAIAKAHQP